MSDWVVYFVLLYCNEVVVRINSVVDLHNTVSTRTRIEYILVNRSIFSRFAGVSLPKSSRVVELTLRETDSIQPASLSRLDWA